MVETKTSSHLDVLTQKNLLIFTGALGLLFIGGIIIFGLNVLLMGAVSYAVALVVEYAFSKVRKRPLDKAWFVTPMVFTLLMPPTSPWWLVLIGSFFGVFFGKAVFGGTGKYIFNPAAVGVLFLMISFPNEMLTQWLNPQTGDIITRTPILDLKLNLFNYKFTDLLIGNVPGAVGETMSAAIIVLGLVLIALKIIDWRIPLTFVVTVFVATFVGGLIDADSFYAAHYAIFTGGLLFSAFFVATDPVAAPVKPWGRVVFGIGLGLLTVIIRHYSAFYEGVIFAVIIMNATSGLIDNWRQPKEGESEQKEVEA